MLCNANLPDRAVFAMWSLEGSWSSKITPRFLSELYGVIVDESIWKVKSACMMGPRLWTKLVKKSVQSSGIEH